MVAFPSISIGVILEQSITALIVISYLAYEIRWGRVNGLVERIESLSNAVVALARVEGRIKTHMVSEDIKDRSPGDYIKDPGGDAYVAEEYVTEEEDVAD